MRCKAFLSCAVFLVFVFYSGRTYLWDIGPTHVLGYVIYKEGDVLFDAFNIVYTPEGQRKCEMS
jgi:hypothetical protein